MERAPRTRQTTSDRGSMLSVTLYSKAGCHLCDEAREHLEDLAADFPLDISEVDIRRDPELFERYRYRIPVIVVDGVERLEGRVEAADARDLIERLCRA
jgi:glutaredoxin